MQPKFKPGDRVRLVFLDQLPGESENWLDAEREHGAKIYKGKKLTVSNACGSWVELKGFRFAHLAAKFAHISNVYKLPAKPIHPAQ